MSTLLYHCDYCFFTANHKDKLRLHIYKHRKLFKLSCNVCKKEYKTNQSMRKHLRTHFQKHQCSFCGQVFSYKRLLINHITAIHDELQEIQCKFCTRLFSNTTTRDSHARLVHKDQLVDTKKFRCNECEAGFEMREELRIHSFIHFQGEIHHCLDCNQIFKKKKLLALHMKMHQSASFSCEKCNALFKYRSNLKKHQKKGRCLDPNETEIQFDAEDEARLAREQLVEITKNFTRSVVNAEEGVKKECVEGIKKELVEGVRKSARRGRPKKTETMTKVLKIENIKCEPDDNKKCIIITTLQSSSKRPYTHKRPSRVTKVSSHYLCDLCGFQAIKKSLILSHLRFHVSSARHKCKECELSFGSLERLHKHSLKIHQKGVYGSIEYSKSQNECKFCGKMFSAERITAHMALHQAPKFLCDLCGVALFRTKQALERHMQSRHKKDRKYTCATCGKRYKKVSLKQHEETHNAIKFYIKCEICSKLMQTKNLKLHVELKHGDRYKEKNFVCECGKAFRYYKQLQKHHEQVHEKVNIGNKIYRCVDCNFETTRLSDLRKHSFEHYDGPVFYCEICQLQFKTKKLLQIHSKVHLDNSLRQYPCSKCHCVFQTSGGKRKHEAKVHCNDDVFKVDEKIEEIIII